MAISLLRQEQKLNSDDGRTRSNSSIESMTKSPPTTITDNGGIIKDLLRIGTGNNKDNNRDLLSKKNKVNRLDRKNYVLDSLAIILGDFGDRNNEENIIIDNDETNNNDATATTTTIKQKQNNNNNYWRTRSHSIIDTMTTTPPIKRISNMGSKGLIKNNKVRLDDNNNSNNNNNNTIHDSLTSIIGNSARKKFGSDNDAMIQTKSILGDDSHETMMIDESDDQNTALVSSLDDGKLNNKKQTRKIRMKRRNNNTAVSKNCQYYRKYDDQKGTNLKSCLIKKGTVRSSSCVSKSVYFKHIRIQKYPIILGDNPSVKSGAPITIDWIPYGKERMHSILAYEQFKSPSRPKRKLHINGKKRATMLLNAGYSVDEIDDAALCAYNIKQERIESNKKLEIHDHFSLIMANANDVLSGVFQTTNETLVGAVQTTGNKLKTLVTKQQQQQQNQEPEEEKCEIEETTLS